MDNITLSNQIVKQTSAGHFGWLGDADCFKDSRRNISERAERFKFERLGVYEFPSFKFGRNKVERHWAWVVLAFWQASYRTHHFFEVAVIGRDSQEDTGVVGDFQNPGEFAIYRADGFE